MAGCDTCPQTLSLEELQQFMEEHGLSKQDSRESCIQSVENYLMEQLPGSFPERGTWSLVIDYSPNDLARRRFSAVDYFNMKFGKCTTSRLRDILTNHEQFVPKQGSESELTE